MPIYAEALCSAGVVCPWFSQTSASEAKRIFKLQGLGGRCALNTETTAVKPRVGIESITKRCSFYVNELTSSPAQLVNRLLDSVGHLN